MAARRPPVQSALLRFRPGASDGLPRVGRHRRSAVCAKFGTACLASFSQSALHIKNYNKIKGKMSTTNYNVAHYSLIFVSCASQQRLNKRVFALFNTFVKKLGLKYRRGCKGAPSAARIAVIRDHYARLRARTTSPISPSMQIDRSVIASGHAASPQLTQA